MSTVGEIEAAIEKLPIEQVREVSAWLDEYQASINAPAEVFAMLDAEKGHGEQWQGVETQLHCDVRNSK